MAGRPLRRLREALNNSGASTKRKELIKIYSTRDLPWLFHERDRFDEAARHCMELADGGDPAALDHHNACAEHYLAIDEVVQNKLKQKQ